MDIRSLSAIYNLKQVQLKQEKQEKIHHKDAKPEETQNDSLEISDQSKMLSKIKQTPEIRNEKIEHIRELIREDQLLTQERIRLGIRKMLISMLS